MDWFNDTDMLFQDYNMREYGGTKSVVITGTSFLGNRNSFMGLAYIVMGCICAFLGIVFLIRNFYRPRSVKQIVNVFFENVACNAYSYCVSIAENWATMTVYRGTITKTDTTQR